MNHIVAKLDVSASKLQDTLKVILKIQIGIVSILHQDFPAVLVTTMLLGPMPIVVQGATDHPHFAFNMFIRALLPSRPVVYIRLANAHRKGLVHLAEQGISHVAITRAEDSNIAKPTKIADGRSSRCPRVTCMHQSLEWVYPRVAGVAIPDARFSNNRLQNAPVLEVRSEQAAALRDGLVLRTVIDTVCPHLDYLIDLQLVEGLLHPVRTGKLHIGVDPCDIFGVRRKP